MRLLNSLQSAFSFYLMAAAVVPLLLFGIIAEIYLTELHVTQVGRELSAHTLDIRGEADALIRDARDTLLYFGDECDKLLADDPDKIDGFLQDAVASRNYFQSIFLLDRNGHVRHLGLNRQLAGHEQDFRGIDMSREELLASDRSHAPASGWKDHLRYKWSEVFVSVPVGDPSISLYIHIRGGASLLGTISLTHLGAVLQDRVARNRSIEFAIVDHHGTLVAHTRPELVLQRGNLLSVHPEIGAGLASGREVVVKYHEDNSLLESVRLLGESPWVVHASIPKDVALAPLQRIRILLLLMLTVAALISFLLAVWLARRISRPLVCLEETAGFLARGDYQKAADFEGTRFREVDGLASSFRQMAETVRRREAMLHENKLRFQELYQQFSALLEGITDRITLLSSDWILIWSNQVPESDPDDAVSAPSDSYCFSRYYGRNEPCEHCPAKQVFATGEAAIGEISDTGGRVWNVRAFPVFGTGGAVGKVVTIAEDVTGKREADRQRSRAGQLAALGELAAGVAHEINNPISGVINYAQLILNRAEQGSREHELAQRIIKEGDRIAVIVRELLTFAREESADVRIVSVREALAGALALCESPLRKEGVDLHIDLPAELPPVESRSHQIQQLFLNLISNARHALADKYPQAHPDKRLLISGRMIPVDGRPMLRLKVRDHGTGIPAELLERVMNPFVTTKPAGVGTGLGLSISFEIAKKHGGTLSVASEPGAWTEVTIDLPAYLAA